MQREKLFQELLKKYRLNRLSGAEYRQFIDLLRTEDRDQSILMDDQARLDWEPSKQLLKQYGKKYQRKTHIRRRVLIAGWSSAAAIVLIVMTYFLWPQHEVEDVIYHTNYGETKKITLPDESTVLLNANSKLIWDGNWERTDQRMVELEGEAFFDVTKIGNTPFQVIASDVRVNVLGTAFNVRNRDGDAEVFLHEGEVELKLYSGVDKKISMKPGDFVRYDKFDQAVTIEKDNRIDKKAAWVDGMLEFENRKVRLILQEFEDLYGKKFKIENQGLADKRMDFSLPYADWELVKKALEISIGAEFIETRDTIIVK